MYAGGRNSIGTPDNSHKYQVETFLLAKRHGVRVLGFPGTAWEMKVTAAGEGSLG